MRGSRHDGKYPQQTSASQRPSPSNKRRSLLNSQMKGIVVTSTSGITGKGEAKTQLTLICFNKRERKKGRCREKQLRKRRRKQMGRGGGSNAKTQNLNIWQRRRRSILPRQQPTIRHRQIPQILTIKKMLRDTKRRLKFSFVLARCNAAAALKFCPILGLLLQQLPASSDWTGSIDRILRDLVVVFCVC